MACCRVGKLQGWKVNFRSTLDMWVSDIQVVLAWRNFYSPNTPPPPPLPQVKHNKIKYREQLCHCCYFFLVF